MQLRAICVAQLLQNISLDTFFKHIMAAESCCDNELLDACSAYGATNRYAHIFVATAFQFHGSKANVVEDML